MIFSEKVDKISSEDENFKEDHGLTMVVGPSATHETVLTVSGGASARNTNASARTNAAVMHCDVDDERDGSDVRLSIEHVSGRGHGHSYSHGIVHGRSHGQGSSSIDLQVDGEHEIDMDADGDDDDNSLSSRNSTCDTKDYIDASSNDLMAAAMRNDVTAQLAAAGPVGVAAAAAILSAKRYRRSFTFETNPSVRKRQRNRLLRKLKATIDEFTIRVGQQAIILVATPGKTNVCYKVFGAKPLEDVIKNLKSIIMEELDTSLAQQAPPTAPEDPTLFELPSLVIDGIPTPVEKMTQAQLRAFIPLMLKYSTGRGKPGWGRESTKPIWWPTEVPWANVRMDARSDEEKQKVPWTHALRQIVLNCYKFHNRQDLLPVFNEDDKANIKQEMMIFADGQKQSVIESIKNENLHSDIYMMESESNNDDQKLTQQYTPTVIQTIQNSDGTVSIIQVDPNNPIITLPDGTTAQVQGIATLQSDGGDESHIQTVQTINEDGTPHEIVEINSVTEATIHEGQIIITGEDGQGYPVSVNGMITIPVHQQMYQTVVANIQANNDGTFCVNPIVQDGKEEGTATIEGIPQSIMIQSSSANSNNNGEHQSEKNLKS